MKSLEDRLKDNAYTFFVRCSLCLSYLKEGLEQFADDASEQLITDIRKSILKLSSHPITYKKCEDAKFKFDEISKLWSIDCCTTCQDYLKEIQRNAVKGFIFKEYNWKNSDWLQWTKQNGGWEVAKAYMDPGQKQTQKTAGETDLIGILNFINHSSLPRSKFTNATFIEEAINIRNEIAHSLNMSMSEDDFNKYADLMIKLLEELQGTSDDVDTAIVEIKKVRKHKFRIRGEHDYQVMKDRLATIEKLAQNLQDKVEYRRDQQGESQHSRLQMHIVFDDIAQDIRTSYVKKQRLKGVVKNMKAMYGDDKEFSGFVQKRCSEMESRIKNIDIDFQDFIKLWMDTNEWQSHKELRKLLYVFREKDEKEKEQKRQEQENVMYFPSKMKFIMRKVLDIKK